MNFNNVEFNNSEPIYMQIVNLIKRAVASGELYPDDKLPSVREMSVSLGVNPNTLQRAYGELERLGITYTKRGMGSFIRGSDNSKTDMQQEMGRELALKFLQDMREIGLSRDEAFEIINSLE